MKNKTLPFPLENPPTPIKVLNVAAAIKLLRKAKAQNIPASYHPAGGMTEKRYFPVTHTVWVMGDEQKIKELVEKQ